MSHCNQDKRKHECFPQTPAVCVRYDGPLPKDSKYIKDDCVVVEENIEELYELYERFKEFLDLTGIGKNCIKYKEEDPKKLKIRDVIIRLEEVICGIKNDLSKPPYTGFDMTKIKPKCLVDECHTEFKTLEQLIQAIIDLLCKLKEGKRTQCSDNCSCKCNKKVESPIFENGLL